MTVTMIGILSLIMWYYAGCKRFNVASVKPVFSNFRIEPADGSGNYIYMYIYIYKDFQSFVSLQSSHRD